MSEPAAEPRGAAAPPAKPESLTGALLAILALAAVVGVTLALLGLRVQRSATRGLSEELFGADAVLPYDLEYVGGTALAQQRWVRLARRADAAPDATLPAVVLVGRFQGPLPVRRQFEQARRRDTRQIAEELTEWEKEPEREWLAVLETGDVEWNGLESEYLRAVTECYAGKSKPAEALRSAGTLALAVPHGEQGARTGGTHKAADCSFFSQGQ